VKCVVFLATLFCFSSNAIAAYKTPRFGVIDWFPFGWMQDEKNQGMIVEIAQAIDIVLGVKSDVIVAPVPRVLRGMAEAGFDFTITYRDEEMLSEVEYLTDIGCLRSAVVSMKNKPVKALHELNGLRVAYPGGGYFVKKLLPHLNLEGVEVSQTDMMFRMALRGRLDAFIINDAVWFGYWQNNRQGFVIPVEKLQEFAEPYYLETLPFAISISKKSKHQELGQRIKAIMNNPEFVADLKRIYSKYSLSNAMQCLPEIASK
jgi:ABC-type amino acid transport substrate-binding protein